MIPIPIIIGTLLGVVAATKHQVPWLSQLARPFDGTSSRQPIFHVGSRQQEGTKASREGCWLSDTHMCIKAGAMRVPLPLLPGDHMQSGASHKGPKSEASEVLPCTLSRPKTDPAQKSGRGMQIEWWSAPLGPTLVLAEAGTQGSGYPWVVRLCSPHSLGPSISQHYSASCCPLGVTSLSLPVWD